MNAQQNIKQRINHDIKMRCIPGVAIYIFIWPIVVFTTGYFSTNPKESIFFTLAFLALSLIRFAHILMTKESCNKRPTQWVRVFSVWTLSQAAMWSYLMAICLLDETYEDVAMSVLLVTAGLVTGSGSNLAPYRWLSLSYLSIILLPNVAFSYLSGKYAEITIILGAFWLYSAISTMRLHKEYHLSLSRELTLEKINATDSLTQIYNRRFFDESLINEWKHGMREPYDISLLFIDIDRFKSVNDNYGHQMGDHCLKKIARVLDSCAQRQTDILARFGGEEFAIIAPYTNREGALNLAEKIRDQVVSCPIYFDNNSITITASIGVSTVQPNEEIQPEDLIKQADAALYKAKANGRNRTECF